MSSLAPSGHVVEGKYKGNNVYVWEENKSLMIHFGVLKNGILGSPASYKLYEINASSIVDYQEMGSTTQNANPEAVMKVGFWFGAVAAVAANQMGTQELHSVAVEYPDGQRSLLEINSFAYRTFKSIAFSIDEQKRKKAFVQPALSEEKHTDTPQIPTSDFIPKSMAGRREIRINTDNINASIKRAYMFLEDEDWDTATEYFDTILDMDPEIAEAYLGLAMAKLHCSDRKSFAKEYIQNRNFSSISKEINRARRYANDDLFQWLTELETKRTEQFEIIRKRSNSYQSFIVTTGMLTLGLCKNGTVLSTGNNYFGQCNVSEWKDILSISSSNTHVVGLKTNGTVVATGKNDVGQCDVSDWKNIVTVQAGVNHTVGLKTDGTVVATGSNKANQCCVTSWNNIISIVTSNHHTVGLKSDGTVVAVGANLDNQCDVSNWTEIKSITAGPSVTVGLKIDGTVVVAGPKMFDVSNWRDIIAVSAGDFHIVGLKSNGTLVATGYNDHNQCSVSDWKDIVFMTTGTWKTLGLKLDGTVISVGEEVSPETCDYSNWKDIVAISVGYDHTVGLKANGTVVAVGSNTFNQCDVSGWNLFS